MAFRVGTMMAQFHRFVYSLYIAVEVSKLCDIRMVTHAL